MIAKRIDMRDTTKSRATRLAKYVTDELECAGRVADVFTVNCISDDALLAAKEIEICQARNTRTPPLSWKKDVYYDGHEQTEAERTEKRKTSESIIVLAKERALGKAAEVENTWLTIGQSMLQGITLSIKAIGTVFLIGTVAMIIAEYTQVFHILGSPTEPLLNVLGVPDAAAIAPATVIGIAEMFLPFLYIAELELSSGGMFFICVLGLVQIIYMSEVGTMIIVTKLPISIMDMVVIFLIRTIICIPVIAAIMHLFLKLGWI
jgi:nucleoside recognition membrane protein YjiH